jgi:LPXTG-motif cell wall-anchored protein
VTIDSIEYTIGDQYLTDGDNNKLQAKTSTGELIWETEDVYFHSLYPDDVTILVDYYMTITDTAVIDGNGNVNISQFGVDYVEEGDRDYEYSSDHTPGNTPPEEPKKPTEKKEKDEAVVYTYAVVIKKVDDEGHNLAGAEFQIKGLKKVTKKSDGWYKVAEYDHNDNGYYQEANLKTDKNGILVVDGFQTKWVLDVQETKAPDGYNRLTEIVKVKPIKTGTDATNTSSTIEYDENGVVISTTLTTTYTKNGTQIGWTEKVNNVITYYAGENTTPLADDADLTVDGATTAKQKFEALFTSAADLLDPEKAKEAIVNQTSANIAELQVINQKGAELPSTGGMGTTLLYVGGSILVILAAVLLITKRRMSSEE